MTLIGKSWDLHVTHILERSLEENLAMISDSISYLVSQGRRASFELLVRRTLPDYRAPFELVDFMTVVEKRSGSSDLSSQVMLKVKVDNEVMHTSADGNGPVNALDFALRKALLNFYPELKAVRLADYKVRGWIRAWELKPWSGFS